MAIINAVGYPSANLSHFVSEEIWSFGVRGEFNDLGLNESGWSARFGDLYTQSSMGVVSVGMGTRKDFVGGTRSPFVVDSLENKLLSLSRDALDPEFLRREQILL